MPHPLVPRLLRLKATDARDDRRGLDSRQKRVGPGEVVGLPRRQVDSHGVSERVHHRVDFGAKSAGASSEGLFFTRPFLTPAACWCAWTMAASIIGTRCRRRRSGPRKGASSRRICSTGEPGVHHVKVAEAGGQIATGDADAVTVEHTHDKQAVALGGRPEMTLAAGQQVP